MTRPLLCIRPSFFLGLSALALLIGASSTAQAEIITQTATITQTNPDYLYFNAEDFDRLEFPDGGPSWGVNFDPAPADGSISGKTLQAQESGGNNGGNNDSFAIYKFNFTTPGTYTLYTYRLDPGGQGDSLFPPPDFGKVPFHDPTFGNSVNRWNGINDNSWNRLGDDDCCDSPGAEYYDSGIRGAYTVAAAGPQEFIIEARENNAQYDRFVLHTSASLSPDDLNALIFSDASVANPVPRPPADAFVGFTYTQTDALTGAGTISGEIDASSLGGPIILSVSGVLPAATINQKGTTSEPVPDGMVGFSANANNNSPGVDHGVHLGWSGVVTLEGTDEGGIIYAIDVPLKVPDVNTSYSYEFMLTDDNSSVGGTNDAVGASRVAGWVGDDGDGNRQSGPNQAWEVGPEEYTLSQNFNAQDNANGDDLGITVSFRETTDVQTVLPVFIDQVKFGGVLETDPSTLRVIPEPSTLLLATLGLLGLLGCRRRRRRQQAV